VRVHAFTIQPLRWSGFDFPKKYCGGKDVKKAACARRKKLGQQIAFEGVQVF
jgi:hypothetical protein